MAKIIVITGGSGRLGSMIAKIAREHWNGLQEIRLFDQKSPEEHELSEFASATRGPRVNFVLGSIMNEECLLEVFANADVVLHCAAVIETGSVLSRNKMKDVNARGSSNVVEACLKSGVQALVYTGSLAQIWSLATAQPVEYNESHKPISKKQLMFSEYGASKNEGEEYVLAANGKRGKGGVVLRTCSMRCPGMYGEGDTIFIGRLVKIARAYFYNSLFVVGHSNNKKVQIAYIGNCAWAHIVASRKLLDINESFLCEKELRNGLIRGKKTLSDCVGGSFYYVADHTPKRPLTKLYDQFLSPLGQRVIPIKIPFILIWMLVVLLDGLTSFLCLFGIDFHVPINKCSLQYFKMDHGISWDKARKELNYEPLYDYQTALARSLAFYKHLK